MVRTGGGPNAGHSIHLPAGLVVLHQLSCGVLRKGVIGVSGPGMVIQPFALEEEIRELERRELLLGEVVISDRAHALLPIHEIEDAWQDDLRARRCPGSAFGTARRGSDRRTPTGPHAGGSASPTSTGPLSSATGSR